MEDVSRDTYRDKLANFTTDTNRAPSINIYLINKIKSHIFLKHDKKGYGRFEHT